MKKMNNSIVKADKEQIESLQKDTNGETEKINKNLGLISFIIQEIIKTIRFFSTLDWQKLKGDNTQCCQRYDLQAHSSIAGGRIN